MVSYTAPTTTTSKSLLISRLLLLAVLAVAAILYVAQIRWCQPGAMILVRFEKKSNTETEQERLAVEIAKHSSITSVESRLAALNLVPVDRVDYLSAEVLVARR